MRYCLINDKTYKRMPEHPWFATCGAATAYRDNLYGRAVAFVYREDAVPGYDKNNRPDLPMS